MEAVDKGGCALGILFADFGKGLDLIDHKILLDKLSNLGIHNAMLGWIAAFLCERLALGHIHQHVSILMVVFLKVQNYSHGTIRLGQTKE